MNVEKIYINDWNRCREILEENHSASYIVKNDEGFTLLMGNAAFYRLLQTTEEHLRSAYGNRLGALLDAESLKEIDGLINSYDMKSETPICLKQHIKRNGTDAWLLTEVVGRTIDGSTAFFCTSFDITDAVKTQSDSQSYEEITRFALKQSRIISFEYNCRTRAARIFNADLIFPDAIVEESMVCPNFVEHLIENEIVCQGYEATFRNAIFSLSKNKGNNTCEIQMKFTDEKYHWIRLTLTILQPDHGDRRIAGVLEDITQQKETTRDYLTEALFYQAMLAEKEAYAQVDVTTDRIMRIGGMWNLYNEIINQVSYSQLIEEFINKVVHLDDRRHYLELMKPENFIQSLDNGIDCLGCEFRRIVEQNKMVWMKLSVHLFRDPLHRHVMALLSIVKLDSKNPLVPPINKIPEIIPHHMPHSKQATLVDESDDFDSFVSEQGDLAYLVDADTFDLISGNKAFYDRIGMTASQCKGLKCYELMHKRRAPCPFCSKANWSSDKFYIWKNLNLALEQEFLIKNKLVLWQGREVMLALAVDISNDKSIVDSLENGETESHSILSGVQRMSEAKSLNEAMSSVLETVGCFFQADAAFFWERKQSDAPYTCHYQWTKNGQPTVENGECHEIDTWLSENGMQHQMILENPEAMLCHSYEMYQYMKQHGLRNQRWFRVIENGLEFGYIGIDNSSSNFQNVAFLESISVFIASEIKKRSLIKNAFHANNHDDMTGLLNRNNFEQYMLHFHPDQVTNVAVVVANFDNLKGINSVHGFQTGNYYIKQFSEILCEVFSADHIFRLNGDEFLVISVNVPQLDWENKINHMENLVRDEDKFSVSVGNSWDDTENNLPVLIEQATNAMKVNKKRYYDSLPDLIDTERRSMLVGLMTALERHEFEVFLQPKVDLVSNTVVAAEALIRYRHKKMGLIQPSQFIDMLEQNNLIRYVDLFVFEEVCKQLWQWKQEGLFLPVISLNFSRLTLLEKDILASMETIISHYDISRKYIEIEITESMVDMGKSVLCQVAKDLYDAGFSISLDDFGTKYTNLSLLADIDFSMLKLDKSLVDKLERQSNYQIILKNIISMCKDLRMDVLAEGIETLAQEQILRTMGCLMGQGYLYGKPMSIGEFEEKFIQLRKPTRFADSGACFA